jgi:hypothetical protein
MSIAAPRGARAAVAAAALLAALCGLSTAASGALISEGSGDFGTVPLYRALVFGGIDRDSASDPGFAGEDINGIDYVSSLAPRPLAEVTGTVSANGATFNGTGQSAWSGFYAGRNYARASVSNSDPDDTYYQVAGTGTATSVQFFTPQAQADHATFTWHVSGTESNPSGVGNATGRLDFGATTDPDVTWSELFFDPEDKLDSITRFGPGTYSYTLPIADLGAVIRLFYWSSAFAEIKAGNAPAGSSFALTANYANTFVLENVELFDANGDPISEWTLDDLDQGSTVFDQDGRVGDIDPPPPLPEPAALALLLGALATAAARRRGTAPR